jgi:hypothetical protein
MRYCTPKLISLPVFRSRTKLRRLQYSLYSRPARTVLVSIRITPTELPYGHH